MVNLVSIETFYQIRTQTTESHHKEGQFNLESTKSVNTAASITYCNDRENTNTTLKHCSIWLKRHWCPPHQSQPFLDYRANLWRQKWDGIKTQGSLSQECVGEVRSRLGFMTPAVGMHLLSGGSSLECSNHWVAVTNVSKHVGRVRCSVTDSSEWVEQSRTGVSSCVISWWSKECIVLWQVTVPQTTNDASGRDSPWENYNFLSFLLSSGHANKVVLSEISQLHSNLDFRLKTVL